MILKCPIFWVYALLIWHFLPLLRSGQPPALLVQWEHTFWGQKACTKLSAVLDNGQQHCTQRVAAGIGICTHCFEYNKWHSLKDWIELCSMKGVIRGGRASFWGLNIIGKSQLAYLIQRNGCVLISHSWWGLYQLGLTVSFSAPNAHLF